MKTITLFITLLTLSQSNAQWMHLPNGMNNQAVQTLLANGDNIYAGTYQYLYVSTNEGISWTQTPLNWDILSLAGNGNYIFAGTNQHGVQSSSNNGANWSQTPVSNDNVWSLAVIGNNVFAGTNLWGVFKSTDNGQNWTTTSLGQRPAWALTVNSNNIFAGTSTGVFVSTDNGTSWSQTSLTNQTVASFAVNGSNIFGGTGNGVFKSTDNGVSWSQTSLNNRVVWSMAASGNNIFAGTANQKGVYFSNDNGSTWQPRNEGLVVSATIRALCISGNYVYAGTWGNGVWRRQVNELIGIQPISTEIPNQFSLSQNYPNPFNPSTKIQFALPKNSFATLVIYDALGREVETLVNEQLNAGTYEVDWSAAQFSSGVYYYKLTAGDYTETKKMVLMK